MFKVYMRYGLGIALFLIVYFLVLKFVGLHKYPIFSALNGLIYGIGIYYALKKFKSESTTFKFEKGFEVGLLSGGVATLIFTVFMAVHMYQIDTEFALNILNSWGLTYDKGTFIMLVSIAIMGFSTTVILSLTFMQLLKVSWNTTSQK